MEMHRIVSGIPRYGVDIRERDLPQETEQARALNFNKGCYVGQEIVERIRSRGSGAPEIHGISRRRRQRRSLPAPRSLREKKKSARSPAPRTCNSRNCDKTMALGYIRREVGVPGREVMIGEAKATVVQLPIADAALARIEGSLERRPA